MLYPSVDELVKNFDSIYTLTMTTAKRARQLRDGKVPVVKSRSAKEVSVALDEIDQGKIVYERIRDGIK